jgi:hypothetical protein
LFCPDREGHPRPPRRRTRCRTRIDTTVQSPTAPLSTPRPYRNPGPRGPRQRTPVGVTSRSQGATSARAAGKRAETSSTGRYDPETSNPTARSNGPTAVPATRDRRHHPFDCPLMGATEVVGVDRGVDGTARALHDAEDDAVPEHGAFRHVRREDHHRRHRPLADGQQEARGHPIEQPARREVASAWVIPNETNMVAATVRPSPFCSITEK